METRIETIIGNILASIGFTDVLDILIVAFLVYKLLGFIRETRAETLAKGIVILLLASVISEWAHLYSLHWLLSGVMTAGLIALVVIFQPEIRRGLEHIGGNQFSSTFNKINREEASRIVSEFVRAIESMSQSRTGALLVIERGTLLNEIVETGTIIDSEVSEQLIGTIFYEGSPLHDGAVIVRGDRLRAAGCVLPLTQDKELAKELGTRHRAGIGITENSDALSIIVSEETGAVSVAQNGQLERFLDDRAVEQILRSVYLPEGEKQTPWKKVAQKIRGDRDAAKQ